jgi:pimeloyl-ACP methyl ester carboxylesterase
LKCAGIAAFILFCAILRASSPASQTPEILKARLRSGLSLAYRQIGSGEIPIVFIHGFSLSSATWVKTLAALPPAYRAYAVDLRGFGDSDKAAAGYTYADLGRDLLEFLDALGLSKAVLVGHSFGGCLLQHFAVAYPERVQALVLVGVNAMNKPARGKSPALARRLEEYGGPKANEAVFRDSMPRYFDAANLAPGDLDAFVKIGLQAGDDALRQSLLTLYTYPTIPNEAMARVKAPTLVVVGAHDPIGTFDQAVSIQDAVPTCRIAVIGRCGHSPMWEKPREFNGALFGFLDEVVPPAGKK